MELHCCESCVTCCAISVTFCKAIASGVVLGISAGIAVAALFSGVGSAIDRFASPGIEDMFKIIRALLFLLIPPDRTPLDREAVLLGVSILAAPLSLAMRFSITSSIDLVLGTSLVARRGILASSWSVLFALTAMAQWRNGYTGS